MENSIFLSYSMSRQVSRQLPTRKIAALRQLGFMFGLELGLGGTFSLGGGGRQFSFHLFSIMLCSKALIENVNVKMFKYVQENMRNFVIIGKEKKTCNIP